MIERSRTFIAESAVMLEKLKVLDKIAAADSPVLILGESGTGKELFAEQVHLRSARRQGPFISVNCAALPENLAENELFGHVKGAFSGAENESKGRLELASGGTLFLDEIADVAFSVQAKLLRFLAEKTFEKVGGGVSLSADVRIVAATNKNLEMLVKNDHFRKDLYYRLNVLPVRAPPLRDRPEDIEALAEFFLAKFSGNKWEREAAQDGDSERESAVEIPSAAETQTSAERDFETDAEAAWTAKALIHRHRGKAKKRSGGWIKGFSQEALEAMRDYSWPGNVRELSNCVERACVISENEYIQKDDLQLSYDTGGIMDADFSAYAAVRVGGDMKTALDDFKRRFIKKTLEQNNWNQTRSARVLDLERTYLSRLIKELEIERT